MATYKPKQVVRDLLRRGCVLVKSDGGSHQKIKNPATGATTVIPVHPSRELKEGLVRKIYKQLGLAGDR